MSVPEDMVGDYLSGMSIDDIASKLGIPSDEVIQTLVNEAVRVDIPESDMIEMGLVDDKFQCSICKEQCPLGNISTHSWLALATNRACCKSCRYRKDITKKFGISYEEYDILINSETSCTICGDVEKGRKLVIDHDHITGKIRGLLCNKCNTALGLFRDSPELLRKAISYITS